jgi:hypothetical protein
MLSDALLNIGSEPSDEQVEVLAFGCLTPAHATQFKAFMKQSRLRYGLSAILKGEKTWPVAPEDRDVLYFLAQSFRAHLIKELSPERTSLTSTQQQLTHRAKGLLKELASISLEMAQLVVTPEDGQELPSWFMVEVVRDLPRLVEQARVS